VDHDAALAGAVVHAGIEPVELEREPVSSGVRRAGEEGAEARAVALGLVAERHRARGVVGMRRAAAVGDVLVREHASGGGIQHP